MKKLDLYIVGIGGQGVLTIAEILAVAAQNKGLECNFYPTKGMAQRGGFVKAQLRIGQGGAGPEIAEKTADAVISMELQESLKAIKYIKKGGDILVWAHKWLPTDVMLKRASYPEVSTVISVAREEGVNPKVLNPEDYSEDIAQNIVLLGACIAHTAVGKMFTAQDIKTAMLQRFSKGSELNIKSLEIGLNSEVKNA